MTTAELNIREHDEYWSQYFALRIATSLHWIKDKEVKRAFREDLEDFLRTKVPGPQTRETVTREMNR